MLTVDAAKESSRRKNGTKHRKPSHFDRLLSRLIVGEGMILYSLDEALPTKGKLSIGELVDILIEVDDPEVDRIGDFPKRRFNRLCSIVEEHLGPGPLDAAEFQGRWFRSR